MPHLSDFNYPFPEELIAHSPAEPRDSSRLLVVDRQAGDLAHRHFFDLPSLLSPNTVIVRNNTKVLPARIFGERMSGSPLEILLIKRVGLGEKGHEIWECLTKPGLKLGQQVLFPHSPLTATCTRVTDYTRQLTFSASKEIFFDELNRIGQTPVPPYITWNQEDSEKLREGYQTTFAKVLGSAAAPTAGLHFTPEVDEALTAKGVQIEEITLHVGLGTFLSVKSENVAEHHMHAEWYELSSGVAERLNEAKKTRKKIVTVGTTTTRVLETCSQPIGSHKHFELNPQTGETEIFIYPPYQFKFVDAMITNFHLPKTTLLMMISAFVSTPNTAEAFSNFQSSVVGKAYAEAIQEKYRFYSFGDAMLIR